MKTLTYRQLMDDAEALYREPMREAPFAAICEARKYIASRIDECVDATSISMFSNGMNTRSSSP